MQLAEVKTSSSAAPQIQEKRQPFFSKEGQAPFFSSTNEARTSFFNGRPVQRKSASSAGGLTIGQPNDIYEKEADAMADKVVQRLSVSHTSTALSKTESTRIAQNNIQAKCTECEQEEHLQKSEKNIPQKAPQSLHNQLNSTKGRGDYLSNNIRSKMEPAFGVDFGNVKVHTGNDSIQMNHKLGASAFTHNSDIYFNSGQYQPNNSKGQHLLAHELTHVVQQRGSIQRNMIQCNFAPQSLPTSRGVFDFDMETREGLLAPPPLPAGAKSGVRGNIRFEPAITSPYSNEIALIQIVKLTDSGTGSNVDSGSMVPGRNVKTTEDATRGVEGGFLTDVEHRRSGVDATPGSDLSARYMINQLGVRDRGEFGFKRSNDPADIKKATLFDFPGVTSTASNLDFEFETVAKGDDTNTIYGSLNWSFGIRAGDVVNEHVDAADSQSATFDEALDLHRDFYVHEPVIFYFGFDQDFLQADEIAKIDTFQDYLSRFPDVRLSLTGFADRRGNPDYNLDLSLRRAENVKRALISKGIEEGKINEIILGMGATEQHTSGDRAPNPGQDQDLEANRRGNRRVELTFEHTQSFPGP